MPYSPPPYPAPCLTLDVFTSVVNRTRNVSTPERLHRAYGFRLPPRDVPYTCHASLQRTVLPYCKLDCGTRCWVLL